MFCVKRAGTDRSLVQNARGVSRFRLTGADILREGVPFGLHTEQVVFTGFYLKSIYVPHAAR